jgi:hypothetical protein
MRTQPTCRRSLAGIDLEQHDFHHQVVLFDRQVLVDFVFDMVERMVFVGEPLSFDFRNPDFWYFRRFSPPGIGNYRGIIADLQNSPETRYRFMNASAWKPEGERRVDANPYTPGKHGLLVMDQM